MKWRLIVPYMSEGRYKEWIEEISNTKGIKLLNHGVIKCEGPSESIMYFHLESSKFFFELYRMCTRDYVLVDCFEDMPTICPDRRRSGRRFEYPGLQEWSLFIWKGLI